MSKKTILSLCIALGCTPVIASEKMDDIDNGYEDYTIQRSIEDLTPQERAVANRVIYGCYLGCHRPAKEEVPETLSPKLEGLPAQYFFEQWVDMDNERHVGVSSQMKQIVYQNTPRVMANVALIMEQREMAYNPMPHVLESESFKRGKEIYDKNCLMCHGEQGASTNPLYPSIKGQMPTYLFEQMTGYRDGLRANRQAPLMKAFASILSEQDYRDVIAYVTGQEVKHIESKEFITGIGMPVPKGFVLPDTGQIQSFTDVYGQDSDYSFAPQRFEISQSGKVAKDLNTQLMWEREGSRLWMTAVEGEEYCDALELDGYTDWRFPLMKELASIADFGEMRPAINTDVFLNMPRMSSGIWTFPVSDHKDHAWHIGFPDAHIMGQHTASTKLTRCVRADDGAAYHNMSYVDNKDGTVTEKVTNRMWQQKIDNQRRPWEEAIKYCESLDYAGYQDWRLPNITEQLSIVNYNKTSPAIDEEFFPDTPVKYFFWTSSAMVGTERQFVRPLPPRKKNQTAEMMDLRDEEKGGTRRWGVGFQIGSALGMNLDTPFYSRCIRNP